MSLNISLFFQLLWGFPKRFFLLGRTLASKWGFRPNTESQALAPPTIAPQNFNFSLSSEEKKYNFDLCVHNYI